MSAQLNSGGFPVYPTNSRPLHHGIANAQAAGMNAPDRFELFILGDGEKKVTEAADTRTPNSSIFTFNKEDHTLANMLRGQLLKDDRVLFAGYKIPHPLFATFEMRVQTTGEITPKKVIVESCKALVGDLQTLSREFTKEYELRKMASLDGNAGSNAQ